MIPPDARLRLLAPAAALPDRGVLRHAPPDLGRDDPRVPRPRGAVRPAAAHRRRRGRGLPRRRLGDRPLGAMGQRLVPRDRAARLRRPGALLGVLPALPAARPWRRLVPARPPPGRRRARVAGHVGRRVRAALEVDAAPHGRGDREPERLLPLDLPDDAVPVRGVQRVALPAADGCGVPARGARPLGLGRRSGRASRR